MLTGTECRNHLLSIAMVEPDHVPEGRDARLPEQTAQDVDAQQGNFCATAPNDGIRLVYFVDDSRVRICRECQSVRKRMVRVGWRQPSPCCSLHLSAHILSVESQLRGYCSDSRGGTANTTSQGSSSQGPCVGAAQDNVPQLGVWSGGACAT